MNLSDLAGALADRYRIEEAIGQGGMATVYRAHDRKHDRPVAIKVMKPEVAASIGRERFLREIEIAARLAHPHILPLHDSGEAAGQLYYVTPFVPGETLRARLGRDKRLSILEALRLTREIASALGHAHRHGVVHRDVKPENVLLVDDMALVADFGIARAISGSAPDATTTNITLAGALLGTPRYMSPEQALGEETDARSDLYALACVCYEMLAGEPPFTGATSAALLVQHRTDKPRPVRELAPSVPEALSTVIAKGLAKDPAERYPTAATFVEALTLAASEPSAGPPATAPPEAPNNLPGERTRFVGRERELKECAALLDGERLLTLTGIGGSGKTRLALRLARERLGSFPSGVWFVDLAPIAEESRVAGAVADALGVAEESGANLSETLARHVRDKRMLLVLDNCEHLIRASAELLDRLLSAGQDLRVVATSREGLGVPGERLVSLSPLGLPPATTDREAIASSDAVRLFVDRAGLVLPGFALDGANAGTIAEICRKLDGIPLAIELAAARMKLLSVDQIHAKLEDRFRLLTGGSRTALSRHQTLRATIQWSYDQLLPEEASLLRVLSVFAGGWTLDAAARVAGAADNEFETLDQLGRLVDKSLVLVDRESGGEPRYRLLETVRQYAEERLVEAGEAEAARERHLAELIALAERAYAERIVDEETWGPRLAAEYDNLRAALGVAHQTDPERHLQLAGALGWFWNARSHFHEGREQLAVALSSSEESSTARPTLARALWGAASLMSWGDPKAALAMMERALQAWRDVGDRREIAIALEGMGWARYMAGDEEGARQACEESLRLQQEIGEPALVNRARVALGQMLVGLGDVKGARDQAEAILAFAKPRGDKRSEHFASHYLGDCSLYEEDYEGSLAWYRTSLLLANSIGDRMEATFEVQGVAMSLAGMGRHERALRLGGAVESEWERLGANVHIRFWDHFLERYLGLARVALGPERAVRAWDEGRRMSFEAASAEALEP